MRDLIVKDKTYFKGFIELKDQLIANSLQNIELNKVPKENLGFVRYRIFLKSLEKLIGSYSKGDSIESLKTQYIVTLNYMMIGWDDADVKFKTGRTQVIHDKYELNANCYMIWMLSLAVLLDVSDEESHILESLIVDGNMSDEVIILLLKGLTKKEYTIEVTQTKNLFKKLVKSGEFVDSKSIEKYLEKWYDNTKLFTWHDYSPSLNYHKKQKYNYYGHWSFEAAAIVKILGLDDSSFRDNKYYPKDLVHQEPKKKGLLGKLGF